MPATIENKLEVASSCYHCGNELNNDVITADNKPFCCEGCKTVYEILNQSNLCDYYTLNKHPGKQQNGNNTDNFAFLDDEEIIKKLIHFQENGQSIVAFHIPEIHCSSCVWLLENLHQVNKNILRSRVNFLKKEVLITYHSDNLSLKEVVQLLHRIGYEPKITFDDLENTSNSISNKNDYYKIGVAFFCFGNIMLLSFPEYLGIDSKTEFAYTKLFAYLNFALSLPVILYSAQGFFISAWKGLREKHLNLDVPIVLGLIVMFTRSSYEILSSTGAGFMDTLASLVFLMLVGRLFQNKSYQHISFDRDYKSYLPIAVTVLENEKETTKPISKINVGDRLIIKNNEIIPADAILFNGDAKIDYSFVTGESSPVQKILGEMIYAGGKQTGGAIELEVVKNVSQSYLTQLWNDDAFRKQDNNEQITNLATRISKWFTIAVLLIAGVGFFYWLPSDIDKAIGAFTAVLIITCPCALALSSPFTLGNALRTLGKKGMYLKNANVIEKMAAIDFIVFDKTGTLTTNGDSKIIFQGKRLDDYDKALIKAAVKQSSHPLSRMIANSLENAGALKIDSFEEFAGKGILACINNEIIKIGSSKFVLNENNSRSLPETAEVYVSRNANILGVFSVHNKYREGIEKMASRLTKAYPVAILSGDNDSEKNKLTQLFGNRAYLNFHQSPVQKLEFIKLMQSQGKKVMMVGDGLNDAGALKQSNVGVSLTDDINNFTPSSDAVLSSAVITHLHRLLLFSKQSVNIIKASFVLSLIYNTIGIYFALQGTMSPLIAAILMPVSSVSIILFTTLSVNILARKTIKIT